MPAVQLVYTWIMSLGLLLAIFRTFQLVWLRRTLPREVWKVRWAATRIYYWMLMVSVLSYWSIVVIRLSVLQP